MSKRVEIVTRCVGLWLLVACVSLSGCQRAEDPAVLQQRRKYLLTEEPKGAVGVIEAHAKVAEQASGGQALILVGRVGAGMHETWDPGKAAFVVSDPSVEIAGHDHGPEHDDNCPFCQAEKKSALASTALVKVTDDAGQVLSVDARQLFRLVEGQVVVVRGTASIDTLGNLVIAADGIYPRR